MYKNTEIPTEKFTKNKKKYLEDNILAKYMPFCSLWTGLILEKIDNNTNNTVSNSYVGNYFG